MPRFAPFGGLRYDPAHPPRPGDRPALRRDRRPRSGPAGHPHPSNAMHVELPEPDLRAGLDRYQVGGRAAGRVDERGRVLVLDARPAYYPYRMTAGRAQPPPGSSGRSGCEPTEGDILPHEETLPKASSDRLDLLRAPGEPLPHLGAVADPRACPASPRRADPTSTCTTTTGCATSCGWSTTRVRAITRAVGAGAGRDRRRAPPLRDGPGLPGDGGPPAGDAPGRLRLGDGAHGRAVRGPAVGRPHPPRPSRAPSESRSGRCVRRVVRHRPRRAGRRPAGRAPWGGRVAGPRHAPTTRGCSPRPRAYDAAGSDLDSSLVALAIDGLPGGRVTYRHDWQRGHRIGPAGEAQAAVLLRPVTRCPDLGLGPRPPADAAEEDLLQPEAPHRHGLPARQDWPPGASARAGSGEGRPRNTGAAARPLRRSETAANCAAAPCSCTPP